jgi:hypothetical protein
MNPTFCAGHWPRVSVLCLMAALLLALPLWAPATGVRVSEAQAAKKSAKAKAAEQEKALEEVSKALDGLLAKSQSRLLFSPKDAGSLSEIKYQLIELLQNAKGNPALAKPVYQAGVLFARRDEYLEAYDLLQQLTLAFPESPYSVRARAEIGLLKRTYGEAAFPAEIAAPSSGTPATGGAAPEAAVAPAASGKT